jgi:hypothetical protein
VDKKGERENCLNYTGILILNSAYKMCESGEKPNYSLHLK